ncbi:MAG: nucleoside monophosphate kinase [Candidatus Liptonbacteria bacterium]|nr:nucleoside monophosphate kinase [Candidatus Liptonbacteria bacterium]
MKIAVIIYGPPGSGKGTQANLTAHEFGLIHFDTGRYWESLVHDPKNAGDPTIEEAKKMFDAGILITPELTLKIVREWVERIGNINQGVVMSGSPRTLYEAEGLMPVMEKIFGKENIFPIILNVKPETSILRNSSRIICDLCGNAILKTLLPKGIDMPFCPICGSSFRKRTLDKPEIIEVRLKEYKERTVPIFEYLRNRGVRVHKIDGELPPNEVFKQISKAITTFSDVIS